MTSRVGSGDNLSIHPDLRQEARFAKAAAVMLVLGGLGFFMFSLALLGISTGIFKGSAELVASPSAIGWLVMATSFLLACVLFYYGRHLWIRQTERLQRVSWLIRNVHPRRMRLVFNAERQASEKGQLYAVDARGPAAPEYLMEIRSPDWRMEALEAEQIVEVYQEMEPEGIIAVTTASIILWGFKTPVVSLTPIE